MDIIFDTAKDATNVTKNSVSLSWGALVFDDPKHLAITALHEQGGGHPGKAIGMVDKRLWTAIYTHRGTAFEFLSVRRNNTHEQKAYYRYPARPERS